MYHSHHFEDKTLNVRFHLQSMDTMRRLYYNPMGMRQNLEKGAFEIGKLRNV